MRPDLGTTAAGLFAFVAAFVGVRLVERRGSTIGLLDVPNARSSHQVPTPRGGGLGILGGTAVGLLVLAVLGPAPDRATAVTVGAALVLAMVGLWDDLRHLGVASRLLAQVMVASIVVAARGGFDRLPFPGSRDLFLGWTGGPLAVVWIVGVTNFFNFMDGADGLAGGQAVLSLTVLAWALRPSPSSAFAAMSAAATGAFLLRNWAPARVFLGDVGSAWLGCLLAALPFTAPIDRRGDLVLLVATSLALFLLDPIVTLVARGLRGRAVVVSHRDHLYQQLVDARRSHAPAVTALLVSAAVLTLMAAAGFVDRPLRWVGMGLACLALVVEWVVASAKRRARAVSVTSP